LYKHSVAVASGTIHVTLPVMLLLNNFGVAVPAPRNESVVEVSIEGTYRGLTEAVKDSGVFI
jgi:hypothetical protein